MRTPRGNEGKGRKKGVPNKVTQSVKEALCLAFEGIGGVPALIEWGKEPRNQAEFYKIWCKVMPTQVEHSGPGGAPIQVVTGVPVQEE